MEVTFYNYDDPSTPLNISLRGGFWGTSADLTLGLAGEGPIVGKISRNPWTAKDIWMDKQTVSAISSLLRSQRFCSATCARYEV